MIYLNQAASSWPKPPRVLAAHAAALSAVPAGQFRGGSSPEGADVMAACRKKLGALLGIADADRIYFSSGATDSANAVICGLPLKGRRVLATQTEHNSILRPLLNHRDRVGQVDIVPCDGAGRVAPQQVEAMLNGDTAAVFLNHCSNVTGMVQDVRVLSEIAHSHGALLVLDAAQSAGCVPLDADAWGADALIFTGHKSLFGPQGTGGYYVRGGIPFSPYRYGGTGRDSRQLTYGAGDYEFEPGTQNLPGIAALAAGVEYVLEEGVAEIARREQALIKRLRAGLGAIGRVRLYGGAECLGPVLSFNIDGLKPSDAAYILEGGYGIRVRAGLHCAPLIHKALGTEEFGTVRASVSNMNTDQDVDSLIHAVGEIAESLECSHEDH